MQSYNDHYKPSGSWGVQTQFYHDASTRKFVANVKAGKRYVLSSHTWILVVAAYHCRPPESGAHDSQVHLITHNHS